MTTPGLLAVHPHPDDETVACGGTLARYAAEAIRVKVVTCTRGEAGDVYADIDLGGAGLAELRTRELADALAALGVTEHEYLGYRDSGLSGTATSAHPDAFAATDLEAAAARLASIIRRFRPDVVVGDDRHGTYGHPDHVRAHAVTVRAAALAADTAFEDGAAPWQAAKRYVHALPHSRLRTIHARLLQNGRPSPFGPRPLAADDTPRLGFPDEAVTAALDVSPWLERKRAALEAHASQLGPGSLLYEFVAGMNDAALTPEFFVQVHGDRAGHGVEDDLLVGIC